MKIASYYMDKVLMSKKVLFYRSNGIVTYVQEYVGQTTFNLSFKSNCRLNTVMVDWAISLMISSQFNENLDWPIYVTLNYFNILCNTTIGNLLKCFRYQYIGVFKILCWCIEKFCIRFIYQSILLFDVCFLLLSFNQNTPHCTNIYSQYVHNLNI